jgi:hypothetical protein
MAMRDSRKPAPKPAPATTGRKALALRKDTLKDLAAGGKDRGVKGGGYSNKCGGGSVRTGNT